MLASVPRLRSPAAAPLAQAALLGLAHALVDAGSGYLLFRDVGAAAAPVILLYDVLAFGGQVPLGALVDRLSAARGAAVAGLVLVGAALLGGPWLPLPAAIAVGLGNGLFHVGAGAQVLRRSGPRSADGGVFVGPGALGIFAGVALGTAGVELHAPLVAAIAIALPAVVALVAWDAPSVAPGGSPAAGGPPRAPLALLAAVALLASVVVRAYAGGMAQGTWRAAAPGLLLPLAAAACAGKVLGGFASDRAGWLRVSAAALAGAALLLGPLLHVPAAALAGMLLLQATMPVTLKATHVLLPERPGLAFGLPCLALLAGFLLGLAPAPALSPAALLAAVLLGSAGLVAAGLGWLRVAPTAPARAAGPPGVAGA